MLDLRLTRRVASSSRICDGRQRDARVERTRSPTGRYVTHVRGPYSRGQRYDVATVARGEGLDRTPVAQVPSQRRVHADPTGQPHERRAVRRQIQAPALRNLDAIGSRGPTRTNEFGGLNAHLRPERLRERRETAAAAKGLPQILPWQTNTTDLSAPCRQRRAHNSDAAAAAAMGPPMAQPRGARVCAAPRPADSCAASEYRVDEGREGRSLCDHEQRSYQQHHHQNRKEPPLLPDTHEGPQLSRKSGTTHRVS